MEGVPTPPDYDVFRRRDDEVNSALLPFPRAPPTPPSEGSLGPGAPPTTWHEVVTFSAPLGSYLEASVAPGDLLMVEGALQARQWRDATGQQATSLQVRPLPPHHPTGLPSPLSPPNLTPPPESAKGRRMDYSFPPL